MFLIDENVLGFGLPVNYNDICWVYPLTLRDILSLSKSRFQYLLSILTFSKAELQKETEEIFEGSVLRYLFAQSYYSDTFLLDLEEAFSTFIKEKVTLSFDTLEIIIGEDFSEKRILNEENFDDFQNILRRQNCLDTPEPIPENENPMQRKFRLAREKREAAKRKQLSKSGEAISFLDSIENLICLNVGYNFSNILDLTYFQFNRLLNKATNKYKYELDMQMIAAGADPKKIKPKTWFSEKEK